MDLICIESVIMEDGEQSFTEGERCFAVEVVCPGLNGDPYEDVDVLAAKNDLDEEHFVLHISDSSLDVFFNRHFKVVSKEKEKEKGSFIGYYHHCCDLNEIFININDAIGEPKVN